MKRNGFLEWLGAGYIANHGSKELHKVDAINGKRCRIWMIKNGGYVWNLKKYLKRGYNGCKYCFPKQDKG